MGTAQDGRTVLLNASASGYLEVVNALLDQGAAADTKDKVPV